MRIWLPLFALAACGSPAPLQDAAAPPSDTRLGDAQLADASPGTIAPTAIGVPIGPPVTAQIDPSDGGSITSADGTLTLDFASGAVATTTAITITPIRDESPLGLPTAWRVEPAGLVLAVPAQATIHLAPLVAHRADTATLFVAAQDAQGYWDAHGAATWDEAAGVSRAAAPTTLGDWALTACVALTSDQELALTTAHLAVLRQCDAPPASGHVGGPVPIADPVAWSNQAAGGGAGLGTLTAAGATATLAPPAQPAGGAPITIVTASVSSPTFARAAAPRTIPLAHDVAIASFAQWTVEGRTFTGVIGSSVLSQNGASAIAATDTPDSAVLSIHFLGDREGGFSADNVYSEIGMTPSDLVYDSKYLPPCTTTEKLLTTTVSVTSANLDTHVMLGSFEGTVVTPRGMTTCNGSPTGDFVEVPITGAFRLMWQKL
jgi:hypothetical protein